MRPMNIRCFRFAMLTSVMLLIAGCPAGHGLQFFDGTFPDGATIAISFDDSLMLPAGGAMQPAISGDGQVAAFTLYNVNIISNEVFIHDRSTSSISRASISSDGVSGDQGGNHPALNFDGLLIAFDSDSTQLVSGDTNHRTDVFVHNRQSGQTIRVSVDSAGQQADGSSTKPAMSANGRFVAFNSSAANLIPSDTNAVTDVFRHDLQTGQTQRVSVNSSGQQDDATGGNDFSPDTPSISSDGSYVTFSSLSQNLVTSDGNMSSDIFVRDFSQALTLRVSVSSNGAQADGPSYSPTISADGRYVAFVSNAGNLAPKPIGRAQSAFVHDRDADGNHVFDETCAGCRATELIRVPDDGRGVGQVIAAALSADARYVAYERQFTGPLDAPKPGLTWTDSDVYVFDRQTGLTRRVNVDMPGLRIIESFPEFVLTYLGQSDQSHAPTFSADGRFVAFEAQLSFTYAAADALVVVQDLTP